MNVISKVPRHRVRPIGTRQRQRVEKKKKKSVERLDGNEALGNSCLVNFVGQ